MSPPGQTFIDSRDSPVLIVHKGIPELAESDRRGTWGGVRVGGPGVSSRVDIGHGVAPVFQLRVVSMIGPPLSIWTVGTRVSSLSIKCPGAC